MHKFKGLNGHSKKDKVTYWHGSWRWMCWSFLLPTDLWPSSLSLRFIRSGSFLVSYELTVSECVCFKLLRNCTLTRWLNSVDWSRDYCVFDWLSSSFIKRRALSLFIYLLWASHHRGLLLLLLLMFLLAPDSRWLGQCDDGYRRARNRCRHSYIIASIFAPRPHRFAHCRFIGCVTLSYSVDV